MTTNENKPSKRSKIVCRVLAVVFTALSISTLFMGNTVAETQAPYYTPYISPLPYGTVSVRPSNYDILSTYEMSTYVDKTTPTQYYYPLDLGSVNYGSMSNGSYGDVRYTKTFWGGRPYDYKTDITYTWQNVLATQDSYNEIRKIKGTHTKTGTASTLFERSVFINFATYDEDYLYSKTTNSTTFNNSTYTFGSLLPTWEDLVDNNAVLVNDNGEHYVKINNFMHNVTRKGDTWSEDWSIYYSLDYSNTAPMTMASYVTLTNSIVGDYVVPSPGEILLSPITAFMNLEIFPGFRVWYLLLIGCATAVFGFFLKSYVGG